MSDSLEVLPRWDAEAITDALRHGRICKVLDASAIVGAHRKSLAWKNLKKGDSDAKVHMPLAAAASFPPAADWPPVLPVPDLVKNVEAASGHSGLVGLLEDERLKNPKGPEDLPDTPLHGHLDLNTISEPLKFDGPWKGALSFLWLGPSGYYGPGLHADPVDNVLFQLDGTKRVFVYETCYTEKFTFMSWIGFLFGPRLNHYPIVTQAGAPLHHTFQEMHPELAKLPYHDVTLEPGQALCLPCGALHAPYGSTRSVSINCFFIGKSYETFMLPWQQKMLFREKWRNRLRGFFGRYFDCCAKAPYNYQGKVTKLQ